MKDILLLLIHGYPFDHTMWFSTIASLGANAKVIAPDLPGFGKSDLDSNQAPSLDYYAEFLARQLDAEKHEKVVVAGMSMGGYVALAFAEKYPDRICGLGLISSQSAADTPEARQARQETISKLRANGVSVVIDGIIPRMFAMSRPPNDDLLQYPRQGAEAAGAAGLSFALEAMAHRPDRTDLLKSLNLPVLIVHGTEDRIIPVGKAKELAEECQKAILVEVRGVGHATPLEAPDQVATGLARLMRKCREEALLEDGER